VTIRSEEFFATRLFSAPFHIDCKPQDIRHPFDDVRDILRLAYTRHKDLRIMINPLHARQEEVMYSSKVWPMWEDWKRTLVRLNEEEARRVGQAPFPIWDFSGYNVVTVEPFPSLSDEAARMRWYWESSHYRSEAGALALARIFGGNGVELRFKDFGLLLTSSNIEGHLEKIRSDHAQWSKSNPEIVREIEAYRAGGEAGAAH
jgi:hypothetical protein